ncbi:MAG TPA: transcriptional regulator [Pelagibacterium sp.]|jgi:LacI family transcriptional regulator|uniref:LacI family DNA-binding transcriptional regulator n=1 Tax=uncultured Pelagibacterium sp. TaxID=1159875 RepID=UPI000C457BDA|nr:transcriptional regulator [Pelagibacterium sp.]HCO55407.1 transcriptional regulator [Pelagibacterium sp.]|tara:strand:+ start:274 stop:1362 length:1089 start_codon:yes stop_codon:yes gene_type:complete
MTTGPNRSRKQTGAQNRNVTIKDLAAELDVSITTISRALNGYADVGEKTRKKVIDAARRLGYTPNRNAQRLVTRRSHSIAWVQADDDNKFVDPHFVEVMAGVLREARIDHYDIVMTSETPERQLATYERYVRDGSVDGFIVDLPRPNDPRINFLLEAEVPFVVHGREERQDRYGWVDVDNYGNFYNLTKLILANGHRRIAFINGDERFLYATTRRQAVYDALRDLGHAPETVMYLEGTHPMVEAGFQLTELALTDPSITAFLYSSILLATEGLTAVSRAGRVPGEDVMIASMNDELQYLNLAPVDGQITYVRSSLRAAGRALVAEVIRQCERKKTSGILIPSLFDLGDGVSGEAIAGSVHFA